MVFLLEIRNEDQKKYDEIFIRFKVVNEKGGKGEMRIRNLCGGIGSTDILNDRGDEESESPGERKTLKKVKDNNGSEKKEKKKGGNNKKWSESGESGVRKDGKKKSSFFSTSTLQLKQALPVVNVVEPEKIAIAEDSEGYFTEDSGNETRGESNPQSPIKILEPEPSEFLIPFPVFPSDTETESDSRTNTSLSSDSDTFTDKESVETPSPDPTLREGDAEISSHVGGATDAVALEAETPPPAGSLISVREGGDASDNVDTPSGAIDETFVVEEGESKENDSEEGGDKSQSEGNVVETGMACGNSSDTSGAVDSGIEVSGEDTDVVGGGTSSECENAGQGDSETVEHVPGNNSDWEKFSKICIKIWDKTILPQAVSTPGFPRIALPVLVQKTPTNMDLTTYLTRVQEYMNQLGYHRQGEPKIKVVTNMSIKHQMDTAKSIIKAGEPIKCLHALILGIHFTNCTNYVERFPINFKSNVNGQEYKHVVLGIYLYGMFGAVGISRDPGLQDKPPIYAKLIDLISDFHNSYQESGHVLKEVRIGGIITHDQHSLEPINWKVASSVNMEDKTGGVQEAAFEKITRALRAKMGATCLRSVRPTPSATSPTSGEQTSMNSSLNSSYSSNNAGVASKNPLAKKSKTVSVISSSSKKNTRK